MAKIDTSKIDGYSGMSAEEKLAALEAYDVAPEPDTEVERLKAELAKSKAALSKSNSEAADYKRQLRDKQTDDEKKAASDEERNKKMMEELELLRKDRAISGHKASFLELGYDSALADESAEALYSGNFAKVFANEKKFVESREKAVAAGSLNNQPDLTHGEPPKGGNSVLDAFKTAAGLK